MSTAGFFESQEPQSIVKTKLVTKYFSAWAKVMLPRATKIGCRIAYFDLFAGPGIFQDGSESTPMWVLRHAIGDPKLCSRLVTVFNDKDQAHVASLRASISGLPNIEKLKYQPVVLNHEVGEDVVETLQRQRLDPTLFFIDPWGYKGLSLDLIGNAIKDWGCDCIFFFNYNRINPGLSNPAVVERMNDLFGVFRAERLREKVKGLTSDERRDTIINELAEALKEIGGRFTLPFEFRSQHGERTSHYLIFVSKNFLGYHIMKDVMSGLTSDPADVKNFQYIPVRSPQLRLLFDFGGPHSIQSLKHSLKMLYAGKKAKVWDIYERHSVDTPFTLRNFQDALLELEEEGDLVVLGSERGRKRNGALTLSRDRFVEFHG